MIPIRLSPIFKAFLQNLNSEGIEYLLVGGYAVCYHGYSRPTRDLDVWTNTRPDNAAKISRVIRTWTGGNTNFPQELFEHCNRIVRIIFPTLKIEIVDPVIGQKAKILDQYEVENLGQIEILTVQSGMDFVVSYADRLIDDIDGVKVNIISLPDLKKNQASGRQAQRLRRFSELAVILFTIHSALRTTNRRPSTFTTWTRVPTGSFGAPSSSTALHSSPPS